MVSLSAVSQYFEGRESRHDAIIAQGQGLWLFSRIESFSVDSDFGIRYNEKTMPTPPLCPLRLHGISMAYGRRLLFSDIVAEIAPGRCLVVTGANGAGKSTLLKIIAGLIRPEAGRVEYDGARGYAAPDVQLYGELTGDENLAFFARARGLERGASAGLLAQVGLPPARGRDLISAYSSGMRQRLKLAVSLLGDPPLLIWDEPTATLDSAGRTLVDAVLSRSRAAGRIAVVATNDPAEAERWGDLSLQIG